MQSHYIEVNNKKIPATFLLFIIYLMVPYGGIGIDLYTPSLPAITHYFATCSAWSKLTLAIYLLGYGVGQFFWGTLSDSLGRKKILLSGMSIAVATSLGLALAPSIGVFLVLRVFQGFGAASTAAITKAIVTDCFSAQQIKKIATYLSTVWSIGPIVAPAIGGYLQYYFDWQANFYLLTVYGLAIVLLTLLYVPETNKNPLPLRLKVIFSNHYQILSNGVFIGCLIGMAVVYSLSVLFNTLAPFLIQMVLHYSSVTYGHVALLIGLAYFLGCLLNRFIISYHPVHNILFYSLCSLVSIAVLMLVLVLVNKLSLTLIVVPTFFIIFGSGFVFANCMAYCLSSFRGMAGSANAIMGSLFVAGAGLTSAIASTFHQASAVPLAGFYVILLVFCLLIYVVLMKRYFENLKLEKE